jgi:hypothetical protein
MQTGIISAKATAASIKLPALPHLRAMTVSLLAIPTNKQTGRQAGLAPANATAASINRTPLSHLRAMTVSLSATPVSTCCSFSGRTNV